MFGVCFPQNERLEHEDHIRTKQQNHLITSRQFSRFSHSSCFRFTGPYNSINGPSFYRPTFGLKILTMTKTRMKYSALSPGELQIWDMTWDKRVRKASRTPVMVGNPRPLNENLWMDFYKFTPSHGTSTRFKFFLGNGVASNQTRYWTYPPNLCLNHPKVPPTMQCKRNGYVKFY